MKLSDYVAQFLVEHGIQDVFLVSGGGIMHLLDSVGNQPGLRYTCTYHEQAAAIAAEGYARALNGVGVCLVTTGPASVNAVAGMAGAWINSTPVMVFSGQVRRDILADVTRIRQKGPQEINIVDIVRPITKYAVTIMDPASIRCELEKAYHIAISGRPGPVWIDLPLDIQGSMVDEDSLVAYNPSELTNETLTTDLGQAVAQVLEMICRSRRPIFIGGNGIHLAGATPLLEQLVTQTQIPIVFPYTAPDLLREDHQLNMGVFGTNGQRRANFAVQNSDCLISLASGLCLTKVGFNYRGFAPKARKIIVDIDQGQIMDQVIVPDLPVQADVRAFISEFLQQFEALDYQPPAKWLEACADWKRNYPVIVPEFLTDREHVNSYVFMDVLSDCAVENDILVPGNGLDSVSFYQAFKFKTGQKFLMNGNWGSMGWDLPMAVGACVAKRGRVICVTGDGSVQWNIQELLTIQHAHLPVKLFIFNNQGYASIRATQNNFFEGRKVGADAASGVSTPDFEKLAAAYGFPYTKIWNHDDLREKILWTLEQDGPMICEVNISLDQVIMPKASAFRRADGTLESRPLEDMAPFLPREEIWENMHKFDGDVEADA